MSGNTRHVLEWWWGIVFNMLIDHRALNSSQLQAMGINKLPGYKDPYSGRLLTREKIGCFLSHYNIWKEEQLRSVNTVIKTYRWGWQGLGCLLCITTLCHPLGGAAGTTAGARTGPWCEIWASLCKRWTLTVSVWSLVKLHCSSFSPLPCPFRDEYMQYFEQRNLKTFSVEPLLLFPSHYTGEPGHFSDTESSAIWDHEAVETDWDRDGAKHLHEQETEEIRFRPVVPHSAHGDVSPPLCRWQQRWTLMLYYVAPRPRLTTAPPSLCKTWFVPVPTFAVFEYTWNWNNESLKATF